jgi:hypothetical protein
MRSFLIILAILEDPDIRKIPEDEVAFLKAVGRGGQGEVIKVLYRGQIAAAKSIPPQNLDDSNMSQFLYEIKLFRQFFDNSSEIDRLVLFIMRI